MMMTKSNRGFFSNQEDVTLRLMVRSGQVSNSSKIHPCPPYLQVSGRSNESLTCYVDDKAKQRLFQQSRGNSKINNLIFFVVVFFVLRFYGPVNQMGSC